MSAFDDAYKPFETLPDALPEKCVHVVAPNHGHGNSPLDNLFYWFLRETVRALTRSLFGVELDNSGVSPLTVAAGHNHDQNQYAAMPWWPAAQSHLWFDEGVVTENGGAVLDQTTEADLSWLPFCVPDGCDLAFIRLRCGTQAADDIGYVRVRVYDIASMNGTPVATSAMLELKSLDGGVSALADRWHVIGPLALSSLSSANGVQQGWLRVSGNVAVAGDKAWVSEVQIALTQGI